MADSPQILDIPAEELREALNKRRTRTESYKGKLFVAFDEMEEEEDIMAVRYETENRASYISSLAYDYNKEHKDKDIKLSVNKDKENNRIIIVAVARDK